MLPGAMCSLRQQRTTGTGTARSGGRRCNSWPEARRHNQLPRQRKKEEKVLSLALDARSRQRKGQREQRRKMQRGGSWQHYQRLGQGRRSKLGEVQVAMEAMESIPRRITEAGTSPQETVSKSATGMQPEQRGPAQSHAPKEGRMFARNVWENIGTRNASEMQAGPPSKARLSMVGPRPLYFWAHSKGL